MGKARDESVTLRVEWQIKALAQDSRHYYPDII
jgi:hypothetical protein